MIGRALHKGIVPSFEALVFFWGVLHYCVTFESATRQNAEEFYESAY